MYAAAACCSTCIRTTGCSAWSWSSRTKICYPKSASGWDAVSLQGVTSGVVQRTLSTNPSPSSSGTLVWAPKLTLGDNALKNGFAPDMKVDPRANNKYVIKDPTGDSQDPVIKAVYQAGHWAPNQGPGGGVLFYAWPEGKDGNLGTAARLEYEVFFPKNFTFVKGGKLPGLQGGSTGCGGGADAAKLNCFSGESHDVILRSLYASDRVQKTREPII